MTYDDQPFQWLWAEIARRFGEDQAIELRATFDIQRRAYVEGARLHEYEDQISQLEAQLRELEEAGEPETEYLRDLRYRLEHRRRLLRQRPAQA